MAAVLLGCVGCRSTQERADPTVGSSRSDTTGSPSVRPSSTVSARRAKTIQVPLDAPTIQAAVDSSAPGDLILIAPGTYFESVVADTENIVIRGLDRNTVVLDGRFELDNGILAQANGIAIENLTVRNFLVNGVLFTKAFKDDGQTYANPTDRPQLSGYRVSYVTTYNNEQYGIYAFFATNGQIDHSYASGHPDSGFYIGQCKPCNAVITDSIAEANAIGYQGTNASGNTYIVNSVWSRNRVGITPNSQDMEKLAPQGDVVVAGNLVEDGNDPNTPEAAKGAYGIGIAVGGGTRDFVLRNRIRRNVAVGILVSDLNQFLPDSNRVEGNVLEQNGIDLVYEIASTPGTGETYGNCFAANSFQNSLPANIETLLSCSGKTPSPLSIPQREVVNPPPGVDYQTMPAPPPQASMVNAATQPASPATNMPMKIDVASIVVPAG